MAARFQGGLHPPESKEATASRPVEVLPLPPELVIPLQQHTGAPCQPLVAKGDKVLAGQKIGDAQAFVTAPIHASAAGEVIAVEPRPHFTGVRLMAVVIRTEARGGETRLELPAGGEPTPGEIRSIVREAGIVGLGGAAFPTHVKLSPPKEKPIEAVLINGCECEPFLTCDHRNMLERAERLLDGLELIARTVGARRKVVALEDNKPDAIQHLRRLAAGTGVEIVSLPTHYPQGAEKQLIKAVLGRTIPSGKLPMDVGAVVQNVGTAIAVSEAVRDGLPLTERVITISGSGVNRPANLRVRIGTPLAALVEAAGGLTEDTAKVIVGGPMTGFAQFTMDVPAVKGTSGVLAFRERDVFRESPGHNPCIRCGRCVAACPMILMPNVLGTFARLENWAATESNNVLDCVECGCCGYICPARIPLVQLFKLAKAKVLAARAGKK